MEEIENLLLRDDWWEDFNRETEDYYEDTPDWFDNPD